MIKVSYPLSLKVSLWLVLNLLLLAGLGIGFFVMHGGLGWSSLVAGPTGDRAQSLFNVIGGEAAVVTSESRQAVLDRFGRAYGAEFRLFSFGDMMTGTRTADLPPAVRERVEFRGPPRPFGGRSRGPREPGMSGERPRPGEGEGTRPPPPERSRPEPDSFRRGEPGSGPPTADWRLGRFVVRVESPAGYWVGMRVPFAPVERNSRITPAILLARVDSLPNLLHLLGLQSWLLGGSGVLALSVIFWLPLVRSMTHSVRQLTIATEKIAEGRFDTRVETRRRDELGRLGESVNRMASRLDAHMTGQKRFLGDVAHELCSPLARLQMATGILTEQAPPALRQNVADVRDEVQQISSLVNELLAFTKAGMQSRDVALAPVELEPLARDVLAREETGPRVVVQIPAGLLAMGDRDLLGRALGNLVRNALRYGGDSGLVTVSADRRGNHVTLAVEDQGPGVLPADLDRLGEPFFRPELARTRESGGVGLGLAIVRSSVAACQGEVRFFNREPQGLRVEVRLAAS